MTTILFLNFYLRNESVVLTSICRGSSIRATSHLSAITLSSSIESCTGARIPSFHRTSETRPHTLRRTSQTCTSKNRARQKHDVAVVSAVSPVHQNLKARVFLRKTAAASASEFERNP